MPAIAAALRDPNRLLAVLVLALVARLITLAVWSENLTDDRDGYLALAEGLAAGRGFSSPGTQTPTAYRPPLYPIALVPGTFLPSGIWTALLHLGLGVATVWLTFELASRLMLPRGDVTTSRVTPLIAAAFVAVDPILLRYTALPMTETLATCLVTALLVVLTPRSREGEAPAEPERRMRPQPAARLRRSVALPWIGPPRSARVGQIDAPGLLGQSVFAGVLFGLTALCRPTVWAFAVLACIWEAARWVWRRTYEIAPDERLLMGWVAALSAAVVILPWGLRNFNVFGHPIVMTTHGGYTLLLGNNRDFYREVVDRPWGTVWDGSHGGGQSAWVTDLNREVSAAGIRGEAEQDRWMSERALSNIRAQPKEFVRACWLRLRRFWGIVPVEGADDQPQFVRWGVGTFYALVFLGALGGVICIALHRSASWMLPLLMVLAFPSVHLVYWTNTRMRAPVVPVIAILSAIGWCRLWRR